jgi:hypothetical protein
MRWSACVSFWWVLNLVWPKAKRHAFLVAALFAVYPVFSQQPIAVTYTHYLFFTFYFGSLGVMLLAIRNTRRYYLLTLLALILSAAHLLATEYFWGSELVRPILIFLLARESVGNATVKVKKVFMHWSPYLVLLILIILWRLVFLRMVNDPNAPTMIFKLIQSPASAIPELVQTMLQDILFILAGVWGQLVQPSAIQLNAKITLLAWGMMILSAIGIGIYTIRSYPKKEAEDKNPATQMIGLGGYALVVGLISAWAVDRQVSIGGFADRFALPAHLGASLLLTGIVCLLIPKLNYQAIVLSILIGLAVNAQVRSGNTYRRDWDFQKDFFWQLYWRAPALEPGTALLSEGGIFQYTTKYTLSAAINVLYPVPPNTTDLWYWTFELDDLINPDINPDFIPENDLIGSIRTLTFNTPYNNSIIISYERDKPHCLWVLNTSDADSPYLKQYTSSNLNISNLSRILPEPVNSNYPDETIFGPEPIHTWCYYFQKADLARQFGDWDKVVTLGNQVMELEFGPSNSYEWIPFIEGYIHQKDWEKAQSLTRATFENDAELQMSLCAAWDRALQSTSLSISEQGIANSILSPLGCSAPK